MLVNLLVPGTVKSFGVLFVEFLEAFDASPSTALWIPALCYFLYSSLGKLRIKYFITLNGCVQALKINRMSYELSYVWNFAVSVNVSTFFLRVSLFQFMIDVKSIFMCMSEICIHNVHTIVSRFEYIWFLPKWMPRGRSLVLDNIVNISIWLPRARASQRPFCAMKRFELIPVVLEKSVRDLNFFHFVRRMNIKST